MITYSTDALEYIAKIADGGMRDAITLLDKCLAYSNDLTIENVVRALGVTDYDTLFRLNDACFRHNTKEIINVIESVHMSGKDLKQFVRIYTEFMLDVCKYDITRDFKYIQIPNTYTDILNAYSRPQFDMCQDLLSVLIKLNSDIKWDTNPKAMIESTLLISINK